MPPTIVLVHGAFAESASWDRVIDLLQPKHRVIAAANPLRSLAADAETVSDLVRTIDGPVLLVAHSYGGAVISNVAADAGEITGLVYVNAFAPEPGENCFGLAGMFPGSMLGEATVRPVPRSDGTTDFYIAPRQLPRRVLRRTSPGRRPRRMATTQRPATQEALVEPSGDRPLWKDVPVVLPDRRGGPHHPAPPSSASRPSAPGRSAWSRSPAPRTPSPSRSPARGRRADPRSRRPAVPTVGA